jgi:protein-S-isoprenylcysteine O-methyltransferase Ste14
MNENLVYIKPMLGLVIGGAVGYAVYRFVGCASGTCAITSNPLISVFFWAVITMRREGASIPTGEPTNSLVARGPFKFSRNPIYLSMVCLLLSIGVWANSIWFIGIAASMVVLLNWGVISREELYLVRKFGEEYVTYKQRVRRWC